MYKRFTQSALVYKGCKYSKRKPLCKTGGLCYYKKLSANLNEIDFNDILIIVISFLHKIIGDKLLYAIIGFYFSH
ncbi:hypothetical protein GCM10011573_22790 [Enterococcus wangshanyuanii]|uniref:Transposase n=1 Tax=Enterococcus wangshanyuanii TaxID=2005703 RepID=A0ABQ1PAL8_9ENTE|nr:hypothetical protein GCM10011573_22790 [Enterococcus wangshanyuanii]